MEFYILEMHQSDTVLAIRDCQKSTDLVVIIYY